MNSEFGLLLTILDIESGFSSAFKWSWLLLKAFYHSFFRDQSDVLLLEYGVDAPGDMNFLLSVAKPDIAILTNVSGVHLDEGQFKDLKAIFAEKSKLIEAVPENGQAIINVDNSFGDTLAGQMKGKKKVFSYGQNEKADFSIGKTQMSFEGTSFLMSRKKTLYEVRTSALGEYQAYALVPAIICGEIMGMEIEEAILAIERFKLPPGRMSVIPAVKEAVILDSSYNCAPEALREALKVLKGLGKDRRKVAVIGNMNELGESSKEVHESFGEIVPDHADMLLTVGAQARLIAEKAREKGMKEVYDFKTAGEAAEFFKKKVKKDDLILAKGSQNNVRLERFVKELMLHPEDAKELLVRQERVWQAKM